LGIRSIFDKDDRQLIEYFFVRNRKALLKDIENDSEKKKNSVLREN
jgi:hypothetical protein